MRNYRDPMTDEDEDYPLKLTKKQINTTRRKAKALAFKQKFLLMLVILALETRLLNFKLDKFYRSLRDVCLTAIYSYPRIAEETIAKKCPFCCNTCNCSRCLGMNTTLDGINDEQTAEKEIEEAKILGMEFEEVKPQATNCLPDERLHCNICKTPIFDIHRSCSSCSSDISLTCCLEIRNGKLQACQEDVSWNYYINRGLEYAHGEKGKVIEMTNDKPSNEDRVKLPSMWKLLDLPETVMERCPCFNSHGHIDKANYKRLKAACREGSEDNYLYCPSVRDVQKDDLKHFQHHWVKGEPVVVRNALEVTPGLKLVVGWKETAENLTRIQNGTSNDIYLVQGTIHPREFFTSYTEGRYDCKDWPQVLTLKDQLLSKSFKDNSPRHWEEFLCSLPLKQYTHPGYGPLNLAVKFPESCLEPDMGPNTHPGYGPYGFAEEFGRGDSVTKLHCDFSVVPTTMKLNSFCRCWELFCSEANNEVLEQTSEEVEYIETDEGALWDIFRREDVPKLEKYLEKHHKEFRHMYCCPVTQSCIKVGHDFVSPENVSECFRLSNEYRLLPPNHDSKNDKFEIKKMIVFAMDHALKYLNQS
ncbi:hypothetical protein ARALYDRAFT_890022 [Arabidopsis lyrata subsp. lyrata]|uniref:JmjC domain-containing protein n=1 Tax=Arabidopsis lyrata subsp. lyrata TaxID=81972 RepID=D7KPM2_ARALL|nr:hypothetical protein ARALYDRAFT_890022 [Arabidopsis lyrata subsp. lyrata]